MGDGATGAKDNVRPQELVVIPDNPPPEGAEVIWFEGKNGKKVRMLFAPEPKTNSVKTRGLAIVCPGRTEFIEKYFEVARDLQARGFAVVIFDWPGQGLSERLLANPTLGHVRAYSVYVDALVRGLDKIKGRAPKTWAMFAHSMGCAIALEALRTRRLSVTAACFCSPMWGFPIWFFQRWYARLMRFFGFGGAPARPTQPPETFENNQLTHDERRWKIYRQLIEAEPRLAVGEPTIGWVVSSLNVMREFFEPAALDHLRQLPSLIAVATEETIVKKSAQRKLARRFKEGKVLTVHGAGHEILMETDERREQFWKAFEDMCRRAKV
ncbi:MAG TPA: alpha/beta hydrolase [Hyphomonadaceae bacterium]|nr:alpha/beta hydrolase [Hyphomonadaceae bacterium]